MRFYNFARLPIKKPFVELEIEIRTLTRFELGPDLEQSGAQRLTQIS
jgi:hypothetical protein